MKLRTGLLGLIAAGLVVSARAGEDAAGKTGYETDYAVITNLIQDLHSTLPKARRERVDAPTVLTADTMPFLKPCETTDGTNVLHAVSLSAGFVDFATHLSHARAIDQWNRGFLKRYLTALSQETGATALKDLERPANKRVWSDDTMNAQMSQFNQMVGVLVAIEMAHHYLGHYEKYAAQLNGPGGKPVPINSLLTPQEWHDAVIAGAGNGLECGLRVEGLKFLFDCIDRMETRPAWTACFLPTGTKVSKIKRDLDRLEKEFFDTSEGSTTLLGRK